MAFWSVSYDAVTLVHSGVPASEFSGGVRFEERAIKVSRKADSSRLFPQQERVRAATAARTYRLNKKRVKAKMRSFFELKQSRKFLAFYSISFPEGLPDDECFRVYNTWQTKLRKQYGRFSFIWVAERQKNGTLHFHMLTNLRFPIREVNRHMAVCLQSLSADYYSCRNALERYNGVDVDNVYYSKRHKIRASWNRYTDEQARRKVERYLTKYVSKSKASFTHLSWHESHDLAKLQTSQSFDYANPPNFIRGMMNNEEAFYKYENGFITVWIPKNFRSYSKYLALKKINQHIYDVIQSDS